MYHVFMFNNYYPRGGMDDFVGSFLTREEAVRFANAPRQAELGPNVQIVRQNEDGLLEVVYLK